MAVLRLLPVLVVLWQHQPLLVPVPMLAVLGVGVGSGVGDSALHAHAEEAAPE